MKKIGLLICSIVLSVNMFAEYTVDGRTKSADQEVSSVSLSAGWLGDFKIHRSIVDFDTVYSIGLIERHYGDFSQYPEDGVMMIKLGNDSVYKLFRVPVPLKTDRHYDSYTNKTTYISECLYRLENGQWEQIVENGIKKFRVQYLNNRFQDSELKPKKVVRQINDLKSIKAKFEKKAEDNF